MTTTNRYSYDSNPSSACKKIFKSPFKTQSPPRPSHGRSIPIDTEPHVPIHKNKNVTFSYPAQKSAELKDQVSKKVSEFDSRIEIKAGGKEDGDHRPMKQQQQRIEGKNDDITEKDKFSDYISKVKNKFRTVSNVGAAPPRGAIIGRRDSFNNKVANYISRAKIKMRSMTMVGGDNTK